MFINTNILFFKGRMHIKPAGFTGLSSEGKGEIGYISSPNLQAKTTRVRAAIVHVPVATESLQRPPQSPGMTAMPRDLLAAENLLLDGSKPSGP